MPENAVISDAAILTEQDYCDCLLCEYTHGSDYFSEVLNLNIDTSPILESDNFVFMHDIQPVVAGHCLLMTKDHYLAFAQLPSRLNKELKHIMRLANSFMMENYSSPIIFEHGSLSEGKGSGVCINHAHLHFIPAKLDLLEQLQEYTSEILCNRPINIFNALKNVDEHYMYYQNTNGEGCVLSDSSLSLPQQFVRRIVARKLGKLDWDWKQVLYD